MDGRAGLAETSYSENSMAYELPPLSYPFNALEPHIDAKTMEIHHDKHHQAYITNANKALDGHPDLAAKPVDELLADLSKIPESIRTVLRNNAGGHSNHSFFWKIIGPNAGGTPKGKLAEAISSTFGGFDQFKEELQKAAIGRFGSGWAWLVVNKEGKLQIISTANQDTPISEGLKPVVGVDVWEHSYYLLYQNRRPDYLKAWWNVVNWNQAEKNFEAAL
jgi:Fe-Mn family superoxide dismutase